MLTLAYTRLSEAGDNHVVQEKEIRARAAVDGMPIDVVVRDDDRSAWDETVVREGFERILLDCAAGTVGTVYAWRLDRLCRLPKDLVRVEAAVRAGVDFRFADGSRVEKGMGSAVAYLQVLAAREESDVKSARVRAKLLHLAESGKPHGTQMSTFGLSAKERPILDEIVDRIIGGESIRSVVADLRVRGVTTARGNLWTTTALSQTLRRPVLAAVRTHKGRHTQGDWAPAIDPVRWAQLQRVLARNTWSRGDGPDEVLLRGLVHCGKCGWKMTTHRMNGRMGYMCYSRPERPACGDLGATAAHVDDVVAERLLVRLSEPATLEALAKAAHRSVDVEAAELADELRRVEGELAELDEDRYRRRRLDRARYLELAGPLDDERRRLRARLDGLAAPDSIPSPQTILDGWEAAPVVQRRLWVADHVDRVLILPATKRTPRVFERERVQVRWAH